MATQTEKPASVLARIDREWKITNTDFSGTFDVAFTLNACAEVSFSNTAQLRLLVDDDGNFADATTFSVANGLSFAYNAGTITVSGISNTILPQNSTRFITVASVPVASLPLKILRFQAFVEDENVTIQWKLAENIQNSSFILEKSADAKNWENIIAFIGNEKNSFTDNFPFNGQNYYRLRQIDENTYFSDIVGIFIRKNNIQIFPNPSQKQLTVSNLGDGFYKIQLTDLHGKAIIFHAEKTQNNLQIDVSNLLSGIYLLKIITSQDVTVFRFVKE
ncbi:MAG: T9SS type A sorting domain-containing protein [Verrucomicrobia bacterium]|nr:T9SS type A sorting domain-containing protein [Cytophagales bacterium]